MKILDLRHDLSSYAIRITIKVIELKFVKWQVMMQRKAVNYYYDIYISEMQIRMRFVRKNLFEMLKGKECWYVQFLPCWQARLTVIGRFHLHFILVVRFVREINYHLSSFYLGDMRISRSTRVERGSRNV